MTLPLLQLTIKLNRTAYGACNMWLLRFTMCVYGAKNIIITSVSLVDCRQYDTPHVWADMPQSVGPSSSEDVLGNGPISMRAVIGLGSGSTAI